MARAAISRRTPQPLKRAFTWALGWSYWVRRRLRGRRRAPTQAQLRASQSVTPQASAALPAGAPDAILAANEHGTYCVPRSSMHRRIAQAIIQAQVWERETLELICTTDPSGDIVHAGTFFGDFIPALARSREQGARVWAFEPSLENYECTRITIALNKLDNVTLRHAGLDVRAGTALLATTDRTGLALGGGSRVVKNRAHARFSENESIELLALDEALDGERRVAVLHLDVEGHEQHALGGALRTVARWRPLIVLETLPSAGWIEKHLTPLGYRIEGGLDINTVLRADAQPDRVGAG